MFGIMQNAIYAESLASLSVVLFGFVGDGAGTEPVNAIARMIGSAPLAFNDQDEIWIRRRRDDEFRRSLAALTGFACGTEQFFYRFDTALLLLDPDIGSVFIITKSAKFIADKIFRLPLI